MRAYLREQAKAIGVTPDTLLSRINLRLSSTGQQAPLEKSYTTALQTFFQSRDQDAFPRYVNPDGTPMGTRADWDKWDDQIAKVGAGKARYLPAWKALFAAQERGSNAREKYLISSPNNTDYERFFGFGRDMTDSAWQQYKTGKLVGYTDLQRPGAAAAPANETIRRDKIQELYRASNMDERLHTRVNIWLNGGYRSIPLIGAYQIARKFMLNTAGRSLETLAAHDDPDPSHPPAEESTVGATEDAA